MKFLIFASIFISLSSHAQKIKISEIDKFTKQRRVETDLFPIKPGLAKVISAYLRSVDSSYYLNLYSRGWGAGVIGKDDELIFLLDNDSTITLLPTGIQSYEIGDGSAPDYAEHQYYISDYQLVLLSKSKLKSIRKYYGDGYNDFEIPDKHSGNLAKLCDIFLVEVNKE